MSFARFDFFGGDLQTEELDLDDTQVLDPTETVSASLRSLTLSLDAENTAFRSIHFPDYHSPASDSDDEGETSININPFDPCNDFNQLKELPEEDFNDTASFVSDCKRIVHNFPLDRKLHEHPGRQAEDYSLLDFGDLTDFETIEFPLDDDESDFEADSESSTPTSAFSYNTRTFPTAKHRSQLKVEPEGDPKDSSTKRYNLRTKPKASAKRLMHERLSDHGRKHGRSSLDSRKSRTYKRCKTDTSSCDSSSVGGSSASSRLDGFNSKSNLYAHVDASKWTWNMVKEPGKVGWVGAYSPEGRAEKLLSFMEKRKKRSWNKKIKYQVRKSFADSRLRVKGRFISKNDEQFIRGMVAIVF